MVKITLCCSYLHLAGNCAYLKSFVSDFTILIEIA